MIGSLLVSLDGSSDWSTLLGSLNKGADHFWSDVHKANAYEGYRAENIPNPNSTWHFHHGPEHHGAISISSAGLFGQRMDSTLPLLAGTNVTTDLSRFLSIHAYILRPPAIKEGLRKVLPGLRSVVFERVMKLHHQMNLTVAQHTRYANSSSHISSTTSPKTAHICLLPSQLLSHRARASRRHLRPATTIRYHSTPRECLLRHRPTMHFYSSCHGSDARRTECHGA